MIGRKAVVRNVADAPEQSQLRTAPPVNSGSPSARVLDVALAETLGFSRSYSIRQLMGANREELEAFGPLPTRHGQSRGQAFTEYHLNRQQAVLVCILSRTERAKEVRAEVIRRFDAYEGLTVVQPTYHSDAVPPVFPEA